MGGNQTPPLVAVQLRDLVRDTPRRTRLLATVAERIAMILVAAIFYVLSHAMTRGSELSVAAAPLVL